MPNFKARSATSPDATGARGRSAGFCIVWGAAGVLDGCRSKCPAPSARLEGKRYVEKEKIDRILAKFPGIKGNLIGILHEIQNEFRYLPEEELRYLSKKIDVPMTHIYSIANFYHRFSLTPKGEHELCVCLGTACHVKGGHNLLRQAQKDLKVDEGETTEDMKFTLQVVRCIGACSLAPAVMVDDQTYSKMTPKILRELVHSFEDKEE